METAARNAGVEGGSMKLRKDWKEWWVGLVALVAVSGCAGNNLGDVFGATQDYHITVSASGPIFIDRADFGTFALPKVALGLITVAGEFLTEGLQEKHNLGACKLESHGMKPDGTAIVWSASGLCEYQGKLVSEVF